MLLLRALSLKTPSKASSRQMSDRKKVLLIHSSFSVNQYSFKVTCKQTNRTIDSVRARNVCCIKRHTVSLNYHNSWLRPRWHYIATRAFSLNWSASVHTTLEEIQTQHSPIVLDLCLKKSRLVKPDISWLHCFWKAPFSAHIKTLSPHFQIPLVWRAFPESSVFVTD